MNETVKTPSQIANRKKIIILLSIVIPILTFSLFSIKFRMEGLDFLPPIYATLNGITSILLLSALIAIKMKNIKLHQYFIRICFILSILFLLMYVTYHITNESTKYGGIGWSVPVYYLILISHILLSIVVIPFVLFTYFYAWKGDFVRHKKWARYAWPLWFYVTTSGVVVYLMISPYYIK
ncbi:MAG: DUF420 domain-containing protein [Flavobacteriia bacterium]|nr:DUF420 domain-containing protein [Flavobacteriia bacterium]